MRIWFLPFYFLIFLFYKNRAWSVYRKATKKQKIRPIDSRYKMVKRLARITTFLLKVKINVEGTEHLRKNKPYLLVANHQSNFDAIGLMNIIPGYPGFIIKEELVKSFSSSSFVKIIHSFPIKRDDVRSIIKVFAAAEKYMIEQRQAMVIFPEGKRSHSEKMNDFQPGAFKLATQNHSDILPLSISNSSNVFGKIFRKTITVTYKFHPAISTRGKANDTIIVAKYIKEIIAKGIIK